jgi:hypothetical protein
MGALAEAYMMAGRGVKPANALTRFFCRFRKYSWRAASMMSVAGIVGLGLFLGAILWDRAGAARRHRNYSRHELVVRWPRHCARREPRHYLAHPYRRIAPLVMRRIHDSNA